MDDHVKSQLLQAWNKLGEAFVAELVAVFQQKTSTAPQSDTIVRLDASVSKKPEPSTKKSIRKRLTKRKGKKSESEESEDKESESSDEETYQPPAMTKKARSPSPAASPEESEEPPVHAEPPPPPAPPQPEENPDHSDKEDQESLGLSSSSESSESEEEAEASEKQVEADRYATLVFSADTVLTLLSELGEVKEDPAKVKRILEVMENLIVNFRGDYLPVLRETNVLREMNKSADSFPTDSKDLCKTFLKNMKERIGGKSQTQDKNDEWRKLEKHLNEKIKRKSDTEILAVMRRIDELIPEQIGEGQRDVMRHCFHQVRDLSQTSKHTEVQRKAGALYKRWRELNNKTDEAPEDQLASQRSRLTEKIPEAIKKAKVATEEEGK